MPTLSESAADRLWWLSWLNIAISMDAAQMCAQSTLGVSWMQRLQPLADAPAAQELVDELGNTVCATQVIMMRSRSRCYASAYLNALCDA